MFQKCEEKTKLTSCCCSAVYLYCFKSQRKQFFRWGFFERIGLLPVRQHRNLIGRGAGGGGRWGGGSFTIFLKEKSIFFENFRENFEISGKKSDFLKIQRNF